MVRNIQVIPSWNRKSTEIRIEFANIIDDPSTLRLTLTRGESEDMDNEKVILDAQPIVTFIDNFAMISEVIDATIDGFIKVGIPIFYTVEFSDIADPSVSYKSQVLEMCVTVPDNYALVIQHNYINYLEKVIKAQEYGVFRRSKTTSFCTHCYDDIRMTSSDPSCEYCGGSGRLGAYFRHSKNILVNDIGDIGGSAKQKELFGELDLPMQALRGWTIGTPRLTDGDIIVDLSTKESFEIASINYSKKGNYIVRQAFVAKQIESGSPVLDAIERGANG